MKVWILFSFLALALAKEDKDRSENINDIGVPYDVNGQGYLPIFPFDAFNIGYRNFFNRYPPWAAAVNKEETEKESIISSVNDREELLDSSDSLISEVKEEEFSTAVSEVELIGDLESQSSSGSISYSKSKDSASISLSEVSESESSISYSVSSRSASSSSASSFSSSESSFSSSESSFSSSELSFSSSASSASFSLPSKSVSHSASDKSSSMSVTATAPSEYEVQIPPPAASSQAVGKYPSMEIDREASKTEYQKLKVDDVRKSLKKSYDNLGQLKKKLFKKQDVVGDLSEVIRDLELLCDRICQAVPEKYLVSTARIMF
ncbi:uncharacterized protein LOC118183809 [Stegodyphus dumicola]|uniref:uncharacterized protein LOC118183809 n=1 Tax=Stegodyphus dumicola TaxID=202533 RepID=UPI0015B37880|nr:uncharacterized protein LOC118183809 [Stegodyphus dumicola]